MNKRNSSEHVTFHLLSTVRNICSVILIGNFAENFIPLSHLHTRLHEFPFIMQFVEIDK